MSWPRPAQLRPSVKLQADGAPDDAATCLQLAGDHRSRRERPTAPPRRQWVEHRFQVNAVNDNGWTENGITYANAPDRAHSSPTRVRSCATPGRRSTSPPSCAAAALSTLPSPCSTPLPSSLAATRAPTRPCSWSPPSRTARQPGSHTPAAHGRRHRRQRRRRPQRCRRAAERCRHQQPRQRRRRPARPLGGRSRPRPACSTGANGAEGDPDNEESPTARSSPADQSLGGRLRHPPRRTDLPPLRQPLTQPYNKWRGVLHLDTAPFVVFLYSECASCELHVAAYVLFPCVDFQLSRNTAYRTA